MDLLEIRKEIDRIDTQMVELFEERMKLCENVAKSKIESGKKVFDPEREKQKIDSVSAMAHNEQNAVGVSELFGQIMTISRKLQYRLMAEHGIVEENQFEEISKINKNAKVVTTQRDYLAGITSTDITRRFLLSEDIVKAHDEGILHFHDADYFAQNALHNCDLINLEDML